MVASNGPYQRDFGSTSSAANVMPAAGAAATSATAPAWSQYVHSAAANAATATVMVGAPSATSRWRQFLVAPANASSGPVRRDHVEQCRRYQAGAQARGSRGGERANLARRAHGQRGPASP